MKLDGNARSIWEPANLKFQEAIEAKFETERDKLRFLRFFAELDLAQKRLELQRQKFAARCQQALHAHELAKLRLEATAEREQQRAQQQAERQQQRRHEQAQRDAKQWEREQRYLREQQAARQRALVSPLAGICWSTGDRSSLEPEVYQPEPLAQIEEVGPETGCSEPSAYTESNINPIRLDYASAAETQANRDSDALPFGAVAAACRRHSVDHGAPVDSETEPEPQHVLGRAQPQQAMVAAC